MKKWQKIACLSAGALALTGLAACSSLQGDKGKSSAKDEDTLLMYQIGDKPENLDTLLENANKIIKDNRSATMICHAPANIWCSQLRLLIAV